MLATDLHGLSRTKPSWATDLHGFKRKQLILATDLHGLLRTKPSWATDSHGLKRTHFLSNLSVNVRECPWLITLLHFLVDGLCVCCLYLLLASYGGPALVESFILYNVLAFLTQPLTGMLADSHRFLPMLLPLAVIFLAIAVALASLLLANTFHTSYPSPFTTLIIALPLGVGNSLFHVWGGKTVAVATNNDPRALGLFVSTGAFGLAVGMVLHTWWVLYLFLGLIAIISSRPTPYPSLVGREKILIPQEIRACKEIVLLPTREGQGVSLQEDGLLSSLGLSCSCSWALSFSAHS